MDETELPETKNKILDKASSFAISGLGNGALVLKY